MTSLGFRNRDGRKRAVGMDAELEQFKSEIDLRVLAGTFGYQLDRKDSWAGAAVMRGPNNEKIAIKRDVDGHWVCHRASRPL